MPLGPWSAALQLEDSGSFSRHFSHQEGGVQCDVVALNTAINHLARQSAWQRSHLLLGDMARRLLRKTVVSYSASLVGGWSKVLRHLGLMRSDSVRDNAQTITTVLNSCQGPPDMQKCDDGSMFGTPGAWAWAIRLLAANIFHFGSCIKMTTWRIAMELLLSGVPLGSTA